MRCTYCFYLKKSNLFSKSKTHRMSERILKKMVQQVMTDGESQISFVWQGGEPTLMGIDFFKKAVDFQQKFGENQVVGNGLQTNGILIDREWARFLGRYKFLVGLSLDGTEHIHNKYRRMKGGKGSWPRVVDRAKLLLDSGVAVNALTVVNDYSVRFPEEIYEFHKSLGLNFMQFIPCVEPDPVNPGKTAPFSVDPKMFGRFLVKLFDLWMSDSDENGFKTSVRYFDSVFYSYCGLPAPNCTFQESCGRYLVVEHNGDVFCCDFFVDEKWKLGNVLKGDLWKMLNSPLQEKFGQQKAAVAKTCRQCKWFNHCRGGCTKDRFNKENPGSNYLCHSYKTFFEHADTRMTELAKKWKKEREQKDGTR
jgi:uncharacterized protein